MEEVSQLRLEVHRLQLELEERQKAEEHERNLRLKAEERERNLRLEQSSPGG